MLDKDVKELVYNENGQVIGVKAGDEVVHAKMVLPMHLLKSERLDLSLEQSVF